jgi:hypothetical protein
MSRLDRVWGKAYTRSGAVRSGIDEGTGRKDFAADIAERIPEKVLDSIFTPKVEPPPAGIGRAIWGSNREWQPNIGIDDTD